MLTGNKHSWFVSDGESLYNIDNRGLYYKTFYGSNSCRIVISQSVCQFLSLPPWPNICGQDQEPTISAESSMVLYSGMIEPCPQILDQGGSDRKWQTLQLIMIRQQLLPQKVLQYRPGACVIKLFTAVQITAVFFFVQCYKTLKNNSRVIYPNMTVNYPDILTLEKEGFF